MRTADGCDSRGGLWTVPALPEMLGVAPPLCAQQDEDYAVACCLDEDPDDTFSACRFTRFEDGCRDTDRCTVDTCDPDLGCANVAVDTCYNVQGGGCCGAHGTAGCEESRCQTCVCAIDPSCCTDAWTEECAAITQERCWQACDYACGL